MSTKLYSNGKWQKNLKCEGLSYYLNDNLIEKLSLTIKNSTKQDIEYSDRSHPQ